MKRNLLLWLLFLPFLCTAKHIEFMGLPLNMTIANFTVKAASKGIKHDKLTSSYLDQGVRGFTGTFYGKNAQFFVYYNTKTKIVYRAKACVDFDSENSAERFLNSVDEGLEAKYGEGFTEQGTQDGFSAFTYTIVDKKDSTIIDGETYYTINGTVDGYITTNDYLEYTYTVHIDYTDRENTEKNQQNNLNDL